MIPISNRDIARAFGRAWLDEQKEKGNTEFFLQKRMESSEKKWFILNNKGRIAKRTRSDLVLGKLLGCDGHIEQSYDEWVKIFQSKTEGGI